MRVGMVVFANKWTGAGAVAELNCRALLSVGVDVRLLFVGGRNLERRIDKYPWAIPGLIKERRPTHLRSNVRAVKLLATECDVVVCHLPHDHFLCVVAGVHQSTALVRSFRSPRHIRRDLFHHYLNRRLDGALCANSTLESDLGQVVPDSPVVALPTPLEDRFQPGDGSLWRDRLDIPPRAHVIGAVGKLARGRGFGLFLDAVSRIEAPVHVAVVGHGELQPELEKRARGIGLADRVHWTGYQDEELPALYSAMDVVCFTAPGSDWGHRAISEAQGCGRPVVAISNPGVEDLVEDGMNGRIVIQDASALAEAANALINDGESARRLGESAAVAAAKRRFVPVGDRLALFLAQNFVE